MNEFFNDISKIDSIQESYRHFKNAMDAILNFDTKQASKEMTLAGKYIKDLQRSPADLALLADAYLKLNIKFGVKELIKVITRIPSKFFEVIKDVTLLKYNNYDSDVPMQIILKAD